MLALSSAFLAFNVNAGTTGYNCFNKDTILTKYTVK